jgi:DNA-binding IclR family transcriptional regulator
MQEMTEATTREDDEPAEGESSAQKPRERIEAVERALALLQCFRRPGEILTLAVLAQRSGFYKSTILRAAASLVYMGFLQRDQRGHYSLGSELRRLGALSPAQVTLADLVRPELQKLASFTHETASFYVRDDMDRVCLYRVNSTRSARHHLEEGSRHPLKSGAAGKLLWAFDEAATDETSAAIRTRGWVVSKGDRDPDLAAVAVALLNEDGELLGALTVSGLLTRFGTGEIKTYRKRLLDVVEALKSRLPSRSVLDTH